MNNQTPPGFTTDYSNILSLIDNIDPVNYARTRNFIDGDVSRLSPYISRGVISARMVMEKIIEKGYRFTEVEKFVQELAWRDHWQLIWKNRGEAINDNSHDRDDTRTPRAFPTALLESSTGIEAVDKGIQELYETGYMHNHIRMYTASIACNIARCQWELPARWMYYHLLDGDWASNALSWQWVAGVNSAKKYYANQENINRYTYSRQNGTFLDVDYDDFAKMDCPFELLAKTALTLETPLPDPAEMILKSDEPVYIYNWYNMDPAWPSPDTTANRILLLEPSVFSRYPVCSRSIRFLLDLCANIKGIQVFTGEFSDFVDRYRPAEIHYREHPLNIHYRGIEHQREWLTDVRGEFRSFFAFWQKCRIRVEKLFNEAV